MTYPRHLPIPEEVMEIARTLEHAGHQAWCVGGALRDAILGDPNADYDIATSARPEQVQALFKRTAPVGLKYGTVGVVDRRRIMHEVTTFRRDVSTDGRHPVVEYGVTLEEDLARRDFTINAMAYHPLRQEWRDPFGGADDLERRLIRAVGDPVERFREDYLRILRAIRFAARLDFAIEPLTWRAARDATPGLASLSAERVHDEWFKSLGTTRSLAALGRLWSESGAAAEWLPELDLRRIEALPPASDSPAEPRDPVVLTALITTDPVAALRRMKASNSELDQATALARGPDAPSGRDEVAVRRWLSRVGAGADDLLALATLQQGQPPDWTAAMSAIRERGDPLDRGDLALNGIDIQALGASGPRIGEILAALLERVLERPSLNTREQLLALAKELL